MEFAGVAANEIAPALAALRRSTHFEKAPFRRSAPNISLDDKLERARALLRHTIPNGDPAIVIDRALTALIEQLEKRKMATTTRPRKPASHVSRRALRSRHVPAAVKRAVWTRDQGQCAFVGTHRRCDEMAFLEFHHVRPFAVGGATDVDNLELRCRGHNAHGAACYFGVDLLAEPEEARG